MDRVIPTAESDPMRRPHRSRFRSAAPGILLLSASLALYAPLAGGPYYGDDYIYLFEDPRRALYEYFVSYHDVGGIFRPFQMAWCAGHQLLFGEGTFALQVGQAVIHGLLAWLLLGVLRTLGRGEAPALLGALLFVFSPAAVAGVLGNDTFSQVGSTALGFGAVALAWRYLRCFVATAPCGSLPPPADPAPALRDAAGSAALLGLALLFKETALSFALILSLLLGYALLRSRRAGPARPPYPLVVLLLAYAAVTAGYMLYRARMAPTHFELGGTGNYSFRIGDNILKNQVLLFGAAVLPGSTADAFAAFARRAVLPLGAVAVLTLLWLGLLARGVTLARAWPATLGLLVLASAATFPVTLMNHVSELYAYNMLPLLAVIMTLALAALFDPRRPAARRAVAAVIVLAACAGNLRAVTSKALQMRANGAAAASLAAQAVEYARQLPPGGRMLLVERPRAGAVYYSLYLTSDFQGLIAAERWIKHRSGRSDVSIAIVDQDHAGPADLVLVRDGVELRRANSE